jgi:hypothetical protein
MSTAFRSFRIFRLVALGAGALSLLAAPAAQADRRFRRPAPSRWETAFRGNVLTVEVQVDGRAAPLYRTARSDERRYFEAQRGEEYALCIRNQTNRRVGVLISVDGLNVVSGERSPLVSSEPMYVLDPWETAVIRGWRSSLEHVRQFVFVDEERSYASRTGQENGDLGWIRVLAFEEQPSVSQFDSPWRRQDAAEADAPRAGMAKPVPQGAPQSLESRRDADSNSFPGTGWGDRRHDPVRTTWFDPQPRTCDHLVLRYEYARGLAELGIFRERARERDRGELGFAQSPRR